MSIYDTIVNPSNGKYTTIHGKVGIEILQNYINVYQFGGTGLEAAITTQDDIFSKLLKWLKRVSTNEGGVTPDNDIMLNLVKLIHSSANRVEYII